MFDWSWLLVILGAGLVLFEVMLGGFAGFDLVLIGSTFLIGGAVGLLTHDPIKGSITASALCLAYIAVGRRMLRSKLGKAASAKSNVDVFIGRQGVVQQRIATHEAGMVKMGDEVWRALPVAGAGPFESGALVTVDGVDGVTLLVR